MCDPLTIAGVALSGVSAGLNSAANSRVNSARNDALSAERIRQQGYDQEAANINTKSQDNFKTFGKDQAADATKLGDYFASQQPAPANPDAALPPTSSNITVQELGKQSDKSKAFTGKTGEALGQLRSFGDVLGSKSLDTARDSGYIGQIDNFKRGSSGVLPYELDHAAQAGNGLKTFGDLLGGAGSLVTSAGLAGPKTTPTTLGAYLGYQPPSANTFPKAPASGLSSLFGGGL
jgi:hypothetical protein